MGPQQTYRYKPNATAGERIASLTYGLPTPFVDGTKRSAGYATEPLVKLNGFMSDEEDGEMEFAILWIAGKRFGESCLAEWMDAVLLPVD